MNRRTDSGREPTEAEWREAQRVRALHPAQQKSHPTAVAADSAKLAHVNTYGSLPEYYLDHPFVCRTCGRRQIWKARDQKWYHEEAKGHIDAVAVECHACRSAKRRDGR